ncbi:hypothetical protein [Candidatus Aquiluna sp. UB-MaderosW2red]|uniref:hypothetical protein n=1 Tax=Candidatus Aquiluna sp. UB-MaderosW2red TaxID=1855377 RepID=UPI000875C23A|nr:hypothetical protein [Candidatus Aquiluna sp. UB-MaderosW2red]SCX08408.1 hypothetical protein SAMN05216534_0774 [Candidatus Aquiluna sp. UB-MaderosW2red]
MAIKKKYEDLITVGGPASSNLENSILTLNKAGFKKVSQRAPLMRVTGDWKPMIGTLHGDITLDFAELEGNTKITITVVAAVDNAYALISSPGERIKNKFLEEFGKISLEPSSQVKPDVTARLAELEELRTNGVISDEEYSQARINIISRN